MRSVITPAVTAVTIEVVIDTKDDSMSVHLLPGIAGIEFSNQGNYTVGARAAQHESCPCGRLKVVFSPSMSYNKYERWMSEVLSL